jgi:hypothetical protein
MGEAFGSISNPIKLAEADRPAFESFRIAVILDVRGNFHIDLT